MKRLLLNDLYLIVPSYSDLLLSFLLGNDVLHSKSPIKRVCWTSKFSHYSKILGVNKIMYSQSKS